MTHIIAAGFQHETNTFAASRATLEEFQTADTWPGLLEGRAIRPGVMGTTIPLGGFIAAVDAHNATGDERIDLSLLCWASAEPASFVSDEAFDHISGLILDGVRQAEHIDGIYLDLHGAMVTDSHDDGEGELLARLREITGPNLPVVISLDLHANLTARMVDHASAITCFRTYPHLDMAETGARTLPVLKHLMAGGHCHAAWRQLPYLIPLQAQYTGAEPIRGLYAQVKSVGQEAQSWAEFAPGFPASDIHDAGPSLLAYAATEAKAEAIADRLFDAAMAAEPHFDVTLLDPEDAVDEALRCYAEKGKPSVIADVQDNSGAGGSSDTTGLIRALISKKAKRAIVGMVHDPALASLAHDAGEGAVIKGHLGGRACDEPLAARFRVDKLSDGHFAFGGAMYKGSIAEAGLSAALAIDQDDLDIRVVISSRRCQNLDQAIFTHLGLDPAAMDIVVVKSTVHFRADYESLGGAVITSCAPGLHPCRLEEVAFKHIRSGLRLTPDGTVKT